MEWTNSFVITSILYLLRDWVEDNLFLVVWLSLSISSSPRGVLSGITVMQQQPLCCSDELHLFCLRFFNLSCALLNSTCIHSVCSWTKVGFSHSALKTVISHCFKCVSIFALLESLVLLLSIRQNNCNYWGMTET